MDASIPVAISILYMSEGVVADVCAMGLYYDIGDCSRPTIYARYRHRLAPPTLPWEFQPAAHV